MSSLLYGPGSETLAVVVLNSAELGQVGRTAALSVLLTLLLARRRRGVCWLGDPAPRGDGRGIQRVARRCSMPA